MLSNDETCNLLTANGGEKSVNFVNFLVYMRSFSVYNNSVMNVNDFMPPVGTLVQPRAMTYAERRIEARIALAEFVCAEMQFHRDPSVTSIRLRENGYSARINFLNDAICVQLDTSTYRTQFFLPYEGSGRTVQDWLFNQNSCFNLRIVKLLEKARRDNLSREGSRATARKELLIAREGKSLNELL